MFPIEVYFRLFIYKRNKCWYKARQILSKFPSKKLVSSEMNFETISVRYLQLTIFKLYMWLPIDVHLELWRFDLLSGTHAMDRWWYSKC